MKTHEGAEVQLYYSWLQHWMEASGHIHAPHALPSGKASPVLIRKEAGWAPEKAWKLWRRKNHPLAGKRTPAVQLVTRRYTEWALPTPKELKYASNFYINYFWVLANKNGTKELIIYDSQTEKKNKIYGRTTERKQRFYEHMYTLSNDLTIFRDKLSQPCNLNYNKDYTDQNWGIYTVTCRV
jgi:hypothetical protein